jgi:hypothetical protein
MGSLTAFAEELQHILEKRAVGRRAIETVKALHRAHPTKTTIGLLGGGYLGVKGAGQAYRDFMMGRTIRKQQERARR